MTRCVVYKPPVLFVAKAQLTKVCIEVVTLIVIVIVMSLSSFDNNFFLFGFLFFGLDESLFLYDQHFSHWSKYVILTLHVRHFLYFNGKRKSGSISYSSSAQCSLSSNAFRLTAVILQSALSESLATVTVCTLLELKNSIQLSDQNISPLSNISLHVSISLSLYSLEKKPWLSKLEN